MALLAIDHVQVAIPVGREDEARHFFGVFPGLSEFPRSADLAKRSGCWFAIGDQRPHRGVEADFRPARRAHVAVKTDLLEILRGEPAAGGFEAFDDTAVDGRSRIATADAFGNRIEFIAA